MSVTLDIFSIATVPSNYSWDRGTPTIEYDTINTDVNSCSSINEFGELQYIGYAPYMFVTLSSDTGMVNPYNIAIKRSVNFGDYYNSELNISTSAKPSADTFCHTFMMPGTYSIEYEHTEYIETTLEAYSKPEGCLQRYCVQWYWGNLKNEGGNNSWRNDFTWKNTRNTFRYEKKWRFEPCEEDFGFNTRLYIQPTEEKQKNLIAWQWYNFVSDPEMYNPYNSPVTWLSAGFQQPEEITWAQSVGPAYNLRLPGKVAWKWNKITNDSSVSFAKNFTWDYTKSSSPGNTTWDYIRDNCYYSANPALSTVTYKTARKAFIKILEIPPTAYLRVFQPEHRTSPLTVRLSPRDIISGSFPIEKIVWDLGDGSPLLVQRRWANDYDLPFYHVSALRRTSDGIEKVTRLSLEERQLLNEDYSDPRNYDIIHTYVRSPETGFCFYPSLTAYASSTDTFDCASGVVGPIKYSDSANLDVKIFQTELTDNGKVILGQVNNHVAVWRADK